MKAIYMGLVIPELDTATHDTLVQRALELDLFDASAEKLLEHLVGAQGHNPKTGLSNDPTLVLACRLERKRRMKAVALQAH